MHRNIAWRALWTTAHRWAGLFTALFLAVAGLTGALTSWDRELDAWLNPGLFTSPALGQPESAPELLKAVERADPNASVSFMPVGSRAGESAIFYVRPRFDPVSRKPVTLGYNQVFIDPVSAKILGHRDTSEASLSREHLVPFLRNVHFRLMIPPIGGTDRWGYWLMGSVALVWLLDCFVGFYLTLPPRVLHVSLKQRLRRWIGAWRVRIRSGAYKLNFDIHRAFGLWTWGVLAVIAFTSFSLNLYDEVFHPVMSVVSRVTPPLPKTTAAGQKVPAIDFTVAMRLAREEADRRGWGTPMGGIYQNVRQGVYNVSFYDRAAGQGNGNMGVSNLYIDASDGRVLRSNVPWEGTAADVFIQLQYPLHSGRILGLPGRVLMSVMGLVVAALSVTGIVIWARKRRARVHGVAPNDRRKLV